MKTYSVKAGDITRKWFIVDGDGKVLGRLATEVAKVLRGKHKPIWTPHLDTGDHVIILNADKVVLTGAKMENKMARRHSGYSGGLKEVPYTKFMAKTPELAVRKAVWGMLPHNSLGRKQLGKLKVYAGEDHPHGAQQPESLKI